MKRTEFHAVLDRRVSGQDSNGEVLADVLNPTALADRPQAKRDRFIEALGSNFSRVLDSFGIADSHAAGTIGHRSEASIFAMTPAMRNAIAQHAWKNSSGLAEQVYSQETQPGLSKVSISAIATSLGVSWSYAADIRRGRRRPHARHWETLTQLVESRGPVE
jgi:hypothetical protein